MRCSPVLWIRAGIVKHQYVGDINDYRKYALLRALAQGGANRIGVCWMLTPDDGGNDGRGLSYLDKPERYRHFDPELFDVLRDSASEPDTRRLDVIEESKVLPGASYFNEDLPDTLSERRSFMDRCLRSFRKAHLVFFDPDNGLEVTLPRGRKNSSKYLYLDEVAAFYEAGKSLLIYQHFPRIERGSFVERRSGQLREVAPGSAVWTFTTAHVVFFLLVHPKSPAKLTTAAKRACECIDPGFIRGAYVGETQS